MIFSSKPCLTTGRYQIWLLQALKCWHTHTHLYSATQVNWNIKLMDKIFIGPLNEKPLLQYHLLSLGNQVHCCCISKIEEDFAQPGCVLGICKKYRNTMTQENIHTSSGELCTHMGIPGLLPARKLAAPKIALASRVAETSQECLTGWFVKHQVALQNYIVKEETINIDPTQPNPPFILVVLPTLAVKSPFVHVNNFCNQQAATMEGILHLSSVKKPVRIVLMVPEHGSRVIK